MDDENCESVGAISKGSSKYEPRYELVEGQFPPIFKSPFLEQSFLLDFLGLLKPISLNAPKPESNHEKLLLS